MTNILNDISNGYNNVTNNIEGKFDKIVDYGETISGAVSRSLASSSTFKFVIASQRKHIVNILSEGNVNDLIVNPFVEDRVELLASYEWLKQKESGGLYVPGTNQSMTWLIHYFAGIGSREQAAWPKRPGTSGKGAKVASPQDVGALAPTNLSPSRIITLYEFSMKMRAGLRFRAILKLDRTKSYWDELHATEILQLAAISALPYLVTDDESHSKLWRHFSSDDYVNSNPWRELKLVVTYGDTFNRVSETWIL